MKTTKIAFTIIFLFASICLNAQLKVLPSGRVETHNITAIYSNSSNPTDGVDIVGDNPSLGNGSDLIWGTYRYAQPNNPGLLSLQSTEGAYFTVRANGHVGVFNNNPSAALVIGTTGTDYQILVNGSVVLTSDERVKENIKDVNNSLIKLKQLRSVSYNLKQIAQPQNSEESVLSDSTGIKKPKFIPKANKDHRSHYGFLAQDVQKLFPDLVYKDSAGMLGVDYIGIIPLMLDALKDQQVQIDAQAKQLADLTEMVEKSTLALQKVGVNIAKETDALTYPVLEQNVPNPFNAATIIGYYLPTTTATASVYVYDMNGVQLKSYSIPQKGKGNITIQGSEFNAGMYLYALIADGKVIDTKRMILTK
jgi:hypothetical protein